MKKSKMEIMMAVLNQATPELVNPTKEQSELLLKIKMSAKPNEMVSYAASIFYSSGSENENKLVSFFSDRAEILGTTSSKIFEKANLL